MNRYIRKLLAVGLGVTAIALCAPAQTIWAAPAEEIAAGEQVTAAAAVLTAPTLTAESTGYDSVTLTWEPIDQAVVYELQQSEDKKTYTTIAAFTPEQELRYTAGGLYTAKTYYYRLVVTDVNGATATSKYLKAKTVLPAPNVTQLEPGAGNLVHIAWSAVEGTAFYRVYRSTTQVGGYKRVKTVYGTSYANKVEAGVTYYYKIMPLRYNPDGKKVRGRCSTAQSVTVKLGVPVITNVVNSEKNSLTVSWSTVADVNGYAVYRSLEKSTGYKRIIELGSDSLRWTDTAVEAGTKYYYKVSAIKISGGQNSYGTKSPAKSKWTISDVPADLAAAQDGSGGVVLNWTPSKAATSYRIYRAQGTGTEYINIASKVTESSYTDTGLTAGETYSYQIEAVHGSLVSEKSAAVTVKIGNIKVNTRTLFLGPGTTGFLSATTELPGTIAWSSADPAVATVSADGTVIGVAPGKTKIIATVGAVTTSVSVTVTDCQLNGIDVSKWQQAIDWKTVKDSGIRFAMLRLAHGTSKDIQFENYYAGAKEQGIPVGIYCYTLAKSVDEGIEEANYLLELLEGKTLDYPIALDLESENQIKNMNKAARTELILEYKRIIEEAGYQFVVYANLNWLNNYIDQTKLAEENVDIWIARYCSQSLGHRYEGGGNVRMWQYSSTGQVDGILDAYGRYINVDLDVCYDGN